MWAAEGSVGEGVRAADPDAANAFLGRGRAYVAKRQLDEAIKDFDRAISVAPAAGASYFLRGAVLLSQKKHKPAMEDFERALKLDKKAAQVTRKMNFPLRFDKRLYDRYEVSSKFMVEMGFSKQPVDFDKAFWTTGIARVDPSRVEKRQA